MTKRTSHNTPYFRDTNRYQVAIRLNIQEQEALRELCNFWGKDEKTIMRLAFQQLVVASKQVSDKINGGENTTASQQEDNACETTSETSPSDSPSQV